MLIKKNSFRAIYFHLQFMAEFWLLLSYTGLSCYHFNKGQCKTNLIKAFADSKLRKDSFLNLKFVIAILLCFIFEYKCFLCHTVKFPFQFLRYT